ncbi:MAG TPA: (2Fe-2S) ferredoxin domain-containing protein [Candidatus Omnitrophota bacterium]|nr:(2Fe-2S) ferredoxin domain-containing protein [Candidatus Omnitrophota bacterium]
MQKLSVQKLDEMKKSFQQKKNWIKVGMSTCGIAAGADKTYQALEQEIKAHQLNISLEKCGCAGMCFAEPLVEVCVEGMPRVTYGLVDENKAKDIINIHVLNHFLVNDSIYGIKDS